MHVIDLSYFVKIYRSKNKHISVNFLRHFHRAGDLHLSGTTRCIYEDVIMKKCLTLLIATVLSGISLTAYAAQPMSNLDSGQLRPAGTVSATGASNLSDLEDKLQAEMTRCSVLQSSTNNPTNVTAFASGCSFRPICKQKTSNMNAM